MNVPEMRKILPVQCKGRLELLTGDEVEKIHRASLYILEKVGVYMPHGGAQEALSAAGARVDRQSSRVYFPEKVVEEALRRAPESFTLYARDPARDLPLDGKHGYLSLDGCGLQVQELETGKVRPSNRKDLERATRVADYLEQISFVWPIISAQDYPREVQALHELAAQLFNTSKHIQAMTAVGGHSARGSVEIAAAAAGGKEALRRRPIISNFQCSISPLEYDPESLEAAAVFAAAGVPVGFVTMQIGCSTAPATLAGSLALGNAEILAGIAYLQAAAPGTPTFYGSCATVMELRSGGVTCGGPEDFLMQVMAAQMARYYRLPANVGTFATGARDSNWHAGVEGAISGTASILAGVDMLCGAGLTNGATLFSFEQLLMDCEIFEIIRRTAEGVEVNEETLALQTIEQVGCRNHYMDQPHTISHMRELWQPMIIDRSPYEKWVKEGRREAREFAAEKARWILENHRPEPLDPKLVAEIDRIIESYRRD